MLRSTAQCGWWLPGWVGSRHNPVDLTLRLHRCTALCPDGGNGQLRRTSELVHRASEKSCPLTAARSLARRGGEADARQAHGSNSPAASPHATASRPPPLVKSSPRARLSPSPSATPRRSPPTPARTRRPTATVQVLTGAPVHAPHAYRGGRCCRRLPLAGRPRPPLVRRLPAAPAGVPVGGQLIGVRTRAGRGG